MSFTFFTFSFFLLSFSWLEIGPTLANPTPQLISQSTTTLNTTNKKAQGTEIRLNSKSFAISWVQWQQNSSLRTAISDIGAMQMLGLEFLSTDNPKLQPIRWFSQDKEGEITLKTYFLNPHRYLDLTELLESVGGKIQVTGNTLNLNFPPSQILGIREGNQSWGKRIVVDLDGPAAWQVSQAKGEGVVMVMAKTNLSLQETFTPNSPVSSPQDWDEDDMGSGIAPAPNSSLFSLEKAGNITKIKVNLPPASGLRTFSLANPHRLVIDVGPNYVGDRRIAWIEGLTWHQQSIPLKGSRFPVNWLEVDLRSPHIALKPILSNPNGREGIAPLTTIARSWQAAAAINGGFFNRNNKLPLGVIRQDSRWLSGPILNRGAIAWNDRGGVKIGRLSLRETLIVAGRRRFPIVWLNSAYVTKGIARYTPDWGANYKTMTDGELLVSVSQGKVISQFQAGKVGRDKLPIPVQGYLLVIRKNTVPASVLAVGTSVSLENSPIPGDFNNYPYILGGGPLLVQNRRIVLNGAAEKFSQAFQQQKASRSAVGITEKGRLILAAVHHRVGGRGATLGEMAQLMQQLGAVEALNLDGGSSTSLALGGQLIDRSPVTAARVHNGIGIFIMPFDTR